MELQSAILKRRMTRSFRTDPVNPDTVARLIDLARRAPSAGNTSATEFLVLTGADRDVYWDTTLATERRESFAFPSLLTAPVLVLVTTRPRSYLERYSEPDKSRTGLGSDADQWPVPFWWVDAGAVVQNLCLLVQEQGLGICLFGVFEHEAAVSERFGIPEGHRIVAALAVGYPTEDPGRPGRSAGRKRPSPEKVIHYGRWTEDQ